MLGIVPSSFIAITSFILEIFLTEGKNYSLLIGGSNATELGENKNKCLREGRTLTPHGMPCPLAQVEDEDEQSSEMETVLI